jgi:cyclophilin family peptidyl-prolyl cis-trans isomerase
MQSQAVQQSTVLGKDAVLRTSLGDVHLKLFGDQCPKTVENFTVPHPRTQQRKTYNKQTQDCAHTHTTRL